MRRISRQWAGGEVGTRSGYWGKSLSVLLRFSVLSRKQSICTRIAFLEKRLKIVHDSILPIESVFIIEFYMGLIPG